ncbi:MAG TPA: TRZ/ATZ family hydrolase [Coxiellaceae bacterium]|nr:TRZ/ATZ family hydrolase [Coxiellaceae bacterium]
MTTIDTLLHARWIVPIIPRNQILENQTLAIHDGKIIDILETSDAKKKYSAKNNIDRSKHVVMPGLINTHTHAPMNIFRGIADDLPLMDWLNNYIWPAEQKIINADSVYHGSLHAITEMIRGGTTCFSDHYFFPLDTARAALKASMRAAIGLHVMSVPTLWAQGEMDSIAKAKVAYANRPHDPLLTWTIAPQGPYTNSDKSLCMAKALAEEYNLQFHIHLHETQAELAIDLKAHGKRPLQRFLDLGLIDEKLIAVHMVHLTEEEIALCAEKKVHISHNPESNLKLASGFAPIVKLMKAGVNVCLGTDGAASNNDLDMFGELRTAAFIAKAVNQDPTVLDAMTALEMATINGAKALRLEKTIGSIEKGKYADIIAVDFDYLNTQPVYNPISHLVYAVNSLQVSDVWIAGKQLLNRGEFTELDKAEIIQDAVRYVRV